MSFTRFKKILNNQLEADEVETAEIIETVEEPVVEEIEIVEEENKIENIYSMSKEELDEHAAVKYGIELDRRKSKSKMIRDLLTKLKGE